jgi:DNA repair exonuclease SbcCD ATPase subunit
MEIHEMRTKYIQLLGEKNKTAKNHATTLQDVGSLKVKYDKALIAQSLIQKAARNTQEKLKYSIEKIVTTAIESVFDEENTYEFKLEFETKNDRTHCSPVFVDSSGEPFDATADLGGSIADIAALASRISMWTLAGANRTDPIFLLDESLKHLSEGFREEASDLLKALCDDLGLQIIMSTHLPILRESANNKILVEKKNGISDVVVEKES